MKNRVKIHIDGKSFTLIGNEPENHIRSVAEYIDKQIKEIRENAQFGSGQDRGWAYILTALNVGNDYFKELEKSLELETRLEDLELELLCKDSELKAMQQKADRLEKQLQDMEHMQNMKDNVSCGQKPEKKSGK